MRSAACALVMILAAAAFTGCSDDDATAQERAGSEQQSVELCRVVGVASTEILAEDGTTFTELLDQDPPTASSKAALGAVTFAYDGGDLGPYKAALDFLIDRYVAADPEFADEVTAPERTDSVDESAELIDAELDRGACS